ncbi:MAG: nucleotidyltransferase domain-containing protein [Elusimicrobiota bacterium]
MVRKTRSLLLSAILLRAALAAGQTVSGQAGGRTTLAPTIPVAGQNAPGVLSPSSALSVPLSPSLSLPLSPAPKIRNSAEKAAASPSSLPQAGEGTANAAAEDLVPAKVSNRHAATGKAAGTTALPLTASPLPSYGRGVGGEEAGGDLKPSARTQLDGLRVPASADLIWENGRAHGVSDADEAVVSGDSVHASNGRYALLAQSPRSVSAEELLSGAEDIPTVPPPTLLDRVRAELFYRSRQASSYDFYFRLRTGEFRRKVQGWQERARGRETAVKDLEGLLLAWRTKGYTGAMSPLGPRTASREVIEEEGLEIFDRYYPGQPMAREAFLRYVGRIEKVVPSSRRSHFRKLVFQAFEETALLPPRQVANRLDAMLSNAAVKEIRRFRSERMPGVLEDFRAMILPAILQENAHRPAGKRILGVVLLGSFAVGLASPSSDMDLQLVTEDGSLGDARAFQKGLKERWAFEGQTNPLSPFEYAVPPNPALLARMHAGYLVFSPYEQVAQALAAPATEASAGPQWRWPGKVYSFLYSNWLRLYIRVSDLWDRISDRGPTDR